jgi:hypothetical protein
MSNPTGRRFSRFKRVLDIREIFSSAHAGATGVPLEVVNGAIDSALVDGPASPAVPTPRRRATDARTALLHTEITENANELPELKAQLGPAEEHKAEAAQVEKRVRAEAPSADHSLKPKIVFAGILAIGELGNSGWAIADALGIDVTGQILDVSPVSWAIVASTATVVTVVNAVAGSLATSPHSPQRRLYGWLLLFGLAVVQAGIRSAVSVQTSIWLMALSFGISLLAGWAAGKAHRAISSTLEIRRAYRNRLRLAEEATATAEAEIKKTEAAIVAATNRRRTLAAESDALAAAPERERAASDNIAQIRQARRQQAKYWYVLGQRFAGKDKAAKDKEDTHV